MHRQVGVLLRRQGDSVVTDIDEYGVIYRQVRGAGISRVVLAKAYLTHLAIQRAKGRLESRCRWKYMDDGFLFAVPKVKKEHGNREKNTR